MNPPNILLQSWRNTSRYEAHRYKSLHMFLIVVICLIIQRDTITAKLIKITVKLIAGICEIYAKQQIAFSSLCVLLPCDAEHELAFTASG